MKKKQSENSEMDGQIKLLEEVKTRVKRERGIANKKEDVYSGNPQVDIDPEIEYKKSLTALADVIYSY